MNQPAFKKLVPVVLLFIFINVVVMILKRSLQSYGFDIPFLLAANAILFVLSLLGFALNKKGATSANVNAFVRGLYSSFLLKLFVIAGGILIYVYAGGTVNLPSLFTAMVIYLLYTSIEVIQLMKIARKKTDA